MTGLNGGISLDQVRAMMRDHGARRLLVKFLSPNDNSKNQIYLGGDLGVVNILPAGEPQADTSGSHAEPIFKASVAFSWLDDEGQSCTAPNAQLILYPQYPEVRFSGFLRGAERAPGGILSVRDAGRVLLLGISPANEVLGYAAKAESAVARELRTMKLSETIGVFQVVPFDSALEGTDSRARLLRELCRINRSGWIPAWRLAPDGTRKDCKGTNCIGVTLESELGIIGNGRSEPDFEGWEVKAHSVTNLDRAGSGVITLMTPEPSAGFYADRGVEAFVRHYGYPDKRGRPDRLNFGGVHFAGIRHSSTGLLLVLDGYDRESETLLRSDGCLALVDAAGTIAAAWPFAKLLAHWQRKHARAVYVPGIRSVGDASAFRYGSVAKLCTGTDYLRLLAALADGQVFYDPGIKIEHASTVPKIKRRSQFRIKMSNLGHLYHGTESQAVCP